ncbi:hypothetical protein L9F63_019468, partial [Diploptera punctata]
NGGCNSESKVTKRRNKSRKCVSERRELTRSGKRYHYCGNCTKKSKSIPMPDLSYSTSDNTRTHTTHPLTDLYQDERAAVRQKLQQNRSCYRDTTTSTPLQPKYLLQRLYDFHGRSCYDDLDEDFRAVGRGLKQALYRVNTFRLTRCYPTNKNHTLHKIVDCRSGSREYFFVNKTDYCHCFEQRMFQRGLVIEEWRWKHKKVYRNHIADCYCLQRFLDFVKHFENSTSASPASPTLGQQNYVQSIDLIISDYMERLGTRLNILETELKYAWRALDLLSQEYIKMWERLEKLEILLYEQQSVIAQLLEFYTVMGTSESTVEERSAVVPASDPTRGVTESADDELQRTIKDLMEDAAAASVAGRDVVGDVSSTDITGSSSSAAAIISELQIEMGMGEIMRMPDEAFYRSLNNAYRDDLGSTDTNVVPPVTSSQLGMIWEEAEDVEENAVKEETRDVLERVEPGEEEQEVYSALDYKDYRGNSPCVNEQDLAQLTRLSVIDQVALEKLQELDRLTTKLQKDSQNLKELQDRLLESPKHKYQQDSDSTTARALTDDTSVIDEQLRQIYAESELENWSYSSSARDSGATSPRHRVLLESSNSMSTSGILSSQSSNRLNYNTSSLLQADITSSACTMTSTPKTLSERYDLSPYAKEFTDSHAFQNMVAAYSSVPQTTSGTFSVTSSQNLNSPPALSGSSIRTRQDGYIGGGGRLDLDLTESRNTPSPSPTSPPPPAPRDSGDAFLMPTSETSNSLATSPSALLGASAISTTSITSPSTEQQGRLSPRTPHSPKSPRLSPKNIVKSASSNIGTAKSDSGLSSMSGWSSIEKSPGSPKSDSLMGRSNQQQLATSPIAPIHLSTSSPISPQDNPLANSLIPGSHHPSAFTTVKSPTSLGSSTHSLAGDSSAVNLVPSPVPNSELSISPRGRPHRVPKSPSASAIPMVGNATTTIYGDFLYRSEQPAIYSVAGSNRQQSFTSVYTSGTSSYVPKTTSSGYPDLVEPCNNNEQHTNIAYRYQMEPDRITSRSHSSTFDRFCSSCTRYESTPSGNQMRSEYNHGSSWLNSSQAHMDPSLVSQMKHDHTSASIRSMDSASVPTSEYIHPQYMDSRRYQQQHYGPMPGGEQEETYPHLRKRNAPDHQQQIHDGQYYDPSGVIVSQSGYISIAADIKDPNFQPDEKVSKKGKLKSAMSSVSSWIPGLSKRHRSHSLPAGVRREDLAMSKEHGRGYMTPRTKGQPHSTSTLPRKKKKNPLASTMSGILQKAKRRSHHSQSMSDPETETEWSGRQIPHSMSRQSTLQQQQVPANARMVSRRNSDMDQVNELPYDSETSEQNQFDSDPASLFPTVGEVKRAAAQNVPTTTEESSERLQFPPVALGGASREFAVSRALGKYRQRQSSTVSVDEQTAQEDIPPAKPNDQLPIVPQKEDEVQEEIIYDEPPIETSTEESVSCSTPQIPPRAEEAPTIEASPSVSSMRSYVSGRHHGARHQQSLEIPWPGGRGEIDEDSRSTHSWRSTSRVSSRRQSTEDSIDSEDEWYCYELRKLEEMERQQDEPVQEIKSEVFEPDEDVKEQMSFVLQELRLKAQAREGVLDEEDYNRQVRGRSEGSMMVWDDDEKDEENIDLEPELHISEPEEPKKKSIMRLAGDDESSSGETSGPDSPNQSMDEMEVDEEEEAAMEAELARSVRSSSGSTLRHGEKQFQGSDSLSREGSVSVPPSEVSISIKVSDGWDSEETTTVREGSISVPASDVWEGEGEAESDVREGAESSTPSIPKVRIDEDSSSMTKEEAAAKDSGPMGSKWKLLKALKERKAEEKIQEAATATAAAEAKTNSTTNGGGAGGDGGGRASEHPTDNPFYSNIVSAPDIRIRRKSIPLVSELNNDYQLL